VNRPNIGSGGNKTNIGQVNIGSGNSANRTNVGNNAGANRPKRGRRGGGSNRPAPGSGKGPAAATQCPAVQQNRAAVPPKSALSGVGDGKRAGQYSHAGRRAARWQQRQGGGGILSDAANSGECGTRHQRAHSQSGGRRARATGTGRHACHPYPGERALRRNCGAVLLHGWALALPLQGPCRSQGQAGLLPPPRRPRSGGLRRRCCRLRSVRAIALPMF